MGLTLTAIPGEVPLVERVWSAHCDTLTWFTSAAKPTTLISFARHRGAATAHVHGPETRATRLHSPPDWEFFGVELRIGAHLPLHSPAGVADLNDALLPTLGGHRILLGGHDFEMPTAQNVDVFVHRLVRAGLLVFDPMIDQIRHDRRPPTVSERTSQLRFRQAVGISHRKLITIERARRAAQFLIAGGTIADAVTVGGYYDQPQLTRAMRWATGHTPGVLQSLTSFLAF